MEWRKISEYGYPENGTRCVVWNNYFMQPQFLVYNEDYECWDDEEGDDNYDKLNEELYPAYIIIDPYPEAKNTNNRK